MPSIQESLRPRINAVAKELEAISTELTLESLGLSCMYLALAKGIASHDASRGGDTFTLHIPARYVIDVRGPAVSMMEGPATLELFLQTPTPDKNHTKSDGTSETVDGNS